MCVLKITDVQKIFHVKLSDSTFIPVLYPNVIEFDIKSTSTSFKVFHMKNIV